MAGKEWIEQWVRHFHERSPAAPEIYHLTTALHVLSSAVGPYYYFEDGPKVVKPNVWCLLVGPSSLAKKSTALNYDREILYSTCKELQMSDAGSVEGLIAGLAEMSNNGVCHVWSCQDEFGRLLSGMKHKDYQSDLKDVLMQLYDGLPLTRRNVKMNWKIDPVYMTLISGCTLNRLSQLLNLDDLEDGFLARFLLSYGDPGEEFIPRPKAQPHWGQTRQWLETELTTVRTAYSSGKYETIAEWSSDAHAFYDAWTGDLASQVRRGYFPGPASSRLEDYFIKLSMLYGLSEKMGYMGQKYVISYEVADKVSRVMVPFVESASMVYSKLGADPDVERVYRYITAEGVSYAELLCACRMNIRKVGQALDTLIASERIRRVDVPHVSVAGEKAAGRPRAYFYRV